MLTRKRSVVIAYTAIVGVLVATEITPLIAQERESRRPDLSGQWQLNQELSENAEAKLARMQPSEAGRHGPGRHGGELFGRWFGGGQDLKMKQARDIFLCRPSWFVLKQDGERIALTGSDGRVRVLTANGRRETVDDREVQTTWDLHRLVSEIGLGDSKVIETYERGTDAARLIVTTTIEAGAHKASVRRVFDAMSPR